MGCLCGVKASSGRPNICDLIQIESSRYMLRGTEETTAAGVPLLCHNAMAGLLELEPAAAPATVLGTESTGRERRARAFHFGDFEHVRRRSFRPRDSHGRGARSSSSSAQVWEVGMGTTGCVELVVEKLLGPYLGAEWLRERVDGRGLVS